MQKIIQRRSIYRFIRIHERKINFHHRFDRINYFSHSGASDGIGQCTALHLAKMGADIIFACRNENKTKLVIEEIQREAPNSKVFFINKLNTK
jgi:hypothetical protein